MFAEAAAKVAETMPNGGWMTLILGQSGALVFVLAALGYTWKKIIPELKEEKKELVKKFEEKTEADKRYRSEVSTNKDAMRVQFQVREDELEKEISKWRDKHTKERTVRAWWQSKAEDLAKRHSEDIGIPRDIDKTYYGEQ